MQSCTCSLSQELFSDGKVYFSLLLSMHLFQEITGTTPADIKHCDGAEERVSGFTEFMALAS